MRFGRMDKRFNQNTYQNIVNTFESLTGKSINEKEKQFITRGAEEVDLVRSGLEETMINSYHQIMDVYHGYDKVDNLRDAAFICALNKVANDYMTLGVFP